MSERAFAIALCVLVIGFGMGRMAFAASNSPPPMAAGGSDDNWGKDVTVMAIAPDGTWGVGTDAFISRAIAMAIADCKRKYRREIGCGYRQVSIRAGWSLLFRCGNENIIVAERRLADAQEQARRQERELRLHYQPQMPPCVRTAAVDPHGAITAPTVGSSRAP